MYGDHVVLVKIYYKWINSFTLLMWNNFFSTLVTFHEHSQSSGQQEQEKAISSTPLCHFHTFHRHLDIIRVITLDRSLLYIASSRTQTGNLWVPRASRQPPTTGPCALLIFKYSFLTFYCIITLSFYVRWPSGN